MQTPEEAWAAARKGRNLTKLAAQVKVSRQAIHSWTRVPEHRLKLVSRLTGVPRETLRPDLYPPEPWSAL